ncbi:MAG: DUF433 domain-containing protein [Caldilineaceae bacterium]
MQATSQPIDQTQNGSTPSSMQLTRELYGGEVYEYYPLGQYIVAAPGVCGGRPTFKYTRLEASMILAWLANGETIEEVVKGYARSKLTPEAVREAIQLASQALVQSTQALQREVA